MKTFRHYENVSTTFTPQNVRQLQTADNKLFATFNVDPSIFQYEPCSFKEYIKGYLGDVYRFYQEAVYSKISTSEKTIQWSLNTLISWEVILIYYFQDYDFIDFGRENSVKKVNYGNPLCPSEDMLKIIEELTY